MFSCYKHLFQGHGLEYTRSMDALLQTYAEYRELMRHWDEVLPGRVIHIKYEELVQDLEPVARRLLRLIGLRWEDRVLDFHTVKRVVHTFSSDQVTKPLYNRSIGSWRRYEEWLKPFHKKLKKKGIRGSHKE